jgi:hypothetical protein
MNNFSIYFSNIVDILQSALIPKSNIFRFENYWVDHADFLNTVALHWNNSPVYANASKNLSSKLKHVRAGLRKWSKNLSKLSKLIYNCNWVLLLMDGLEEQRPLSNLEKAFKGLVKGLLHPYWNPKGFIGNRETLLDGLNLGMKIVDFFTPWLL